MEREICSGSLTWYHSSRQIFDNFNLQIICVMVLHQELLKLVFRIIFKRKNYFLFLLCDGIFLTLFLFSFICLLMDKNY